MRFGLSTAGKFWLAYAALVAATSVAVTLWAVS